MAICPLGTLSAALDPTGIVTDNDIYRRRNAEPARATILADSDKLVLWHGRADRTSPGDRMSQQEAAELVQYLTTQVERGSAHR